MEQDLEEKRARLAAELVSCGSVAVAFSGGVDSTLVLAAAQEALGARAVAFTAASPFAARTTSYGTILISSAISS